MSVVFVEKRTRKLEIVESGKWSTSTHPAASYEPIGIVVIPGSHGVLKDGTGTVNQCGVMSIVPMNYDTPEKGGTSNQQIRCGGYNVDISGQADGLGRYDSISDGLTNYNRVMTVAGTFSSYGYFPRQGSVGGKPTWTTTTTDICIPSPYLGSDLKSGGYNTLYGDKSKESEDYHNALADFKGIVNTKILTDISTKQSDWRTAATIINNFDSGYHPAACCCARYKTIGTKAFVDCSKEELNNGMGFWYLPAAGEFGYILPRLYDINDTISKLKTAYSIGVQFDTYSCWTSSEKSEASWLGVSTGNGYIDGYSKNSGNYYVRAFMRL